MSKSIEFMDFWKTMNDVLQSRGFPALRYGEAKGFFNQTPSSAHSEWRNGLFTIERRKQA